MKHPAKSSLLTAAGLYSVLALSAVLASSAATPGQTLSGGAREQMAKLDFLVGEWKGQGWMYHYDGSKSEISQSMKVSREADGSALRVKETKRVRVAGFSDAPAQPHESTVSYDEQSKLYRWRVASSNRPGNPFEVKLLGPRSFQWVLHTRDGMLRTTINVNDNGEWHEERESLRSDGWVKLQETVLKRVK